jgi:hypothetical protein
MTPNLSLPPSAKDDPRHDDLVGRLSTMTTATSRSGPTPVRTPPKTQAAAAAAAAAAATSVVSIQERSSQPAVLAAPPAYPARPAHILADDMDRMADSSALARQLSNTSDDSTALTDRRCFRHRLPPPPTDAEPVALLTLSLPLPQQLGLAERTAHDQSSLAAHRHAHCWPAHALAFTAAACPSVLASSIAQPDPQPSRA